MTQQAAQFALDVEPRNSLVEEWQPISTAPRGKRVIVWLPTAEANQGKPMHSIAYYYEAAAVWTDQSGVVRPSHWMDLKPGPCGDGEQAPTARLEKEA